MNIKQEDFDKLKQLDRIEYRQNSSIIIISSMFFGLTGIIIASFSVLFAIIDKWFYWLAFVSISGFCAYKMISTSKKYGKKLNEKYFKIEVKK